MSADPHDDLTPMRAIVLPGMEEAEAPASVPTAEPSEQADQPSIALQPPAPGRRTAIRVAVGVAALGLLIGSLAYSFTREPGSPQLAPATTPLPGVTPPRPQDSAIASTPGASPSAQAETPGGTAPAASAGGKPRASTASLGPAAVTVVKTSGVGCANDLAQNWYTNGQDASWSENAGGASGCGRFVAMPMSGDPSVDGNPYVVWWFETSPVMTGSCAVTVYIPDGQPGDVAGSPAHYKILGGRTSSTVLAEFTIDQTVNRGQWVNAGTYPVNNGAISVHLGNRGLNPNGERLGAAQVQVSCKPA